MFTLALDAPAAGAARLRLSGHLDDSAARDVLHAAADVVKCGCSRLVVDLGGLISYDDEAAFAVVGCHRLARFLPDGVDVVAPDGPGSTLAETAGVAAGVSAGVAAQPAAAHAPGSMAPCPAC
ncbi:MAG: hypothetical protein WD794_00185 [Mycobacteriales bacterium]